MTYSLLAEGLRLLADAAQEYFKNEYDARKFACEAPLADDLPLKPTWQATTRDGYQLCIEVRQTPMAPTLYEFVNRCAARGFPARLWVAVGDVSGGSEFVQGLKSAKEMGVGVVHIPLDGTAPLVLNRPVALSLFALRKTELKGVQSRHRQIFRDAENSFLEGSPEEGCRKICVELEAFTRRFAKRSYDDGWWKLDKTAKTLGAKFFADDSWSAMLDQLDSRIIESKAKAKCNQFKRAMVAGVRQHTGWRNSLSHKVKSLRELEKRDRKLRTMFETTRDLLVDWFEMARPLKLDT